MQELRRLYVWIQEKRGVHVLAADCWCVPAQEDYREDEDRGVRST